MRKNIIINSRGFSLLEMIVVLTILAITASTITPVLGQAFLLKAGEKTALDMSTIEDAARAYYVDKNSWPKPVSGSTSIDVLKSTNYLPQNWTPVNPFGNAYVATPSASFFTVTTLVREGSEKAVSSRLPASSISGSTVSSSVLVPGDTNAIPTGTITPWPSNSLPPGYLWCAGQIVNIADYPDLFTVIGTTYGGDGTNTFGIPDFRDRTIVGKGDMNGTAANRINNWSSINTTLGGTFGEDAHRQTVNEMAPHQHDTFDCNSPFAGCYVDIRGEGAWKGLAGGGTGQGLIRYQTGPNGGNNDGTGLGTRSNVIQPSIAQNYIIKY